VQNLAGFAHGATFKNAGKLDEMPWIHRNILIKERKVQFYKFKVPR
jgi:hypothetical protein